VDEPGEVRPEIIVFPRTVEGAQLVTLFCGRLDEMDVQPFHELVADGCINKARFRHVEQDEEGEARVQAPVVVATVLKRTFWACDGLLDRR
jgi:hypothetical protein